MMVELTKEDIDTFKLMALQSIRVNQFDPVEDVTKTDDLVNTTSEYVYSKEFERGYLYVITFISAYDDDNAPTMIRLGVDTNGEELILNAQATTAAKETVEFGGQIILKATDRIFADIRGGTANDKTVLSISGYRIKV